MAYHKSAKKRIRQTIKRTARNRTLRSSMRTAIKKYRTLLEQGNAGVASEAYPKVQKTIDKMVTKGILHRNTASRFYFSGQGDTLPQMLILALDPNAGGGVTSGPRSPKGSRLRPQAPVAAPAHATPRKAGTP